MADDSDIPWGAIINAAGGVLSGLNSTATSEEASRISQAAYEEMLRGLKERFADYDKIGTAGYEQYIPAQLGASALGGITEDPALRQAQQEQLAALQDVIDRGGMSLADLKMMNDVNRNLNQADTARRKGLANEFAARGQLGAGAQLAMALQGQQDAAESANQRAEATAAQAQDRSMRALMGRGELAGAMSREDYRRAAEAARANDFINQWNASARNEGQKYRNTVRGQAFEDELSKARGKTSLTNSANEVVFGKGQDLSKTKRLQGAYRNDLLDTAGGAATSFANSGSKTSSGTSSPNGTDSGGDTLSYGYSEPLGPEYRPDELDDEE